MIRQPEYAGRFYEKNSVLLKQRVDEYLDCEPIGIESHKVRVIIVPHAGYIYSGVTAGQVYSCIKGMEYDDVVLVGPSHRVYFQGLGIDDSEAWANPLGVVSLSKRVEVLKQKSLCIVNHEAHQLEHSLEVQVPFLQRAISSFSLLPLITGVIDDAENIVSTIDSLLRPNDLLVISTDLSHFHSYADAQEIDLETIASIERFQPIESERACGSMGVNVALAVAKKHHWKIGVVDYKNSGDTAGDTQRVVGYGGIVFYEEY